MSDDHHHLHQQPSQSHSSSPTSIFKRLLHSHHLPPSRSESIIPSPPVEMEEEPEYLFPNKTPAAAMRRQQSYAVKREARELRRARSVSLSALGDRGKRTEMEMRRVRSRDEGAQGHGSSDDEKDDSRRAKPRSIGALVDSGDNREKYTSLSYVSDDEAEEEMDTGIDHPHQVPVLSLGPTVHDALVKSENGTKLIFFDDLPWWMRNNEYVISGYR
jgi:adiponectin receptor